MSEPLKPSPALLCMLGSIIVHADEGLGADGHAFDLDAMRALLANREVKEWLTQMDAIAMVPKRRKP